MEEKIVKTKILIVDDEHGIVDMIQSYFQKQYDILTAYSGQEALQKIASNPDLILLDINMPDIDGLTVCQKIRDQLCSEKRQEQRASGLSGIFQGT